MKTCNGGYCAFKTVGGCLPECKYAGYCDYQCPKDSRNIFITGQTSVDIKGMCWCGGLHRMEDHGKTTG
jgi:hypothetical protein